MSMKFSLIRISIVAAAVLLNLNAADEAPKKSPLEGIWLWNFNMPDGGHVTPRAKFKVKDGELSGTSRFRPGSETPLTNIVFKNGQVSFDVVRDYLGEPIITHYRGKLDGNSITGKIVSGAGGEGQTFDWDAKRVSGIDGVWTWTVSFGERTFDSRVTLNLKGEKLSGKMRTGRGEVDIHRGSFKNNRVHFEVERRGGDGEKTTNVFRGKLEGDEITGTYTSSFGGHRTNVWNAVRVD